MIALCLIRIAMLEASRLANVAVGQISFARALTETRLSSAVHVTECSLNQTVNSPATGSNIEERAAGWSGAAGDVSLSTMVLRPRGRPNGKLSKIVKARCIC